MSLSRSEQARINGAKSRGPKTAEGKRVSSQNAWKHGLTAQSFFVLSTEDPQGLDDVVRSLTETFKPATDLERSFITQAAGAQWRLRRLWALETEAYEHEMDDQREDIEDEHGDISPTRRTYLAYEIIGKRIVDRFGRYESRLTREYERAIRNFDRARKERSEQPPVAPEISEQNEPKPEPAAENTKIQNEPKQVVQLPVHVLCQNEPNSPNTLKTNAEHPPENDLPRCA